MNEEGFWENPCGYPIAEPSGEPPNIMNTSYLGTAVSEADSALNIAKLLRDTFKNNSIATSGGNPESYSSLKYSWLPTVPDVTSERFHEHLNSLEWQSTIKTLFHNLQSISVPFEELVIDFTKDEMNPLKENITQMRGLMMNVLCELRETIAVNSIKLDHQVGRDIMPSELRNLYDNKTERSIRDWIVLRELVNILEYTLAVCTYLKGDK